MNLGTVFLQSAARRSIYYKELCDKTFVQLTEADMHYQPNAECNSIAVIIQHMAGNMLSRWTDFLTTDGEKEWRHRDTEFESTNASKDNLVLLWDKGWSCYLSALNQLQETDLMKIVHIRNEPLTVIDAINRQLAHYTYHCGQIIYSGKIIKESAWQNLSMPRN